MFKKILSTVLLFSVFINNFFFFKLYAYETNSLNNPWSYEKANHLARKTLFWIDWWKVKQLYQAWSASEAVNLLFPSLLWPVRDSYDLKLQTILNKPNFSVTNWDHMKSYYLVKKWNDPYQAKAKLFTIFEDIFSVFQGSEISYLDIENTHNMLYNHTLLNYKEMIKRNLYNNWGTWDYSLGKFLDLFNQTNPNYPNENYSRELLQLFLMLEYLPTESEDNGNTRNYTEEDVNALAKIIFWFESDENTHIVTFNKDKNTNKKVKFLDWNLKTWDSFPFYNEVTWEIDIQILKNPINWNNWLPDNIIDYIFSKREYAISMFLADRFYRFYIAENPTRQELDTISSKIIQNNFEIYPTIKWLLSSDMMYSDKSMNSIIYKTPLDLSLGTANIFWLDFENVRIWSLINLWWNPYFPQSIFGRDWFDDNKSFFTAYTQTQWVNESSFFINNLDLTKIIPDKIYITTYNWNNNSSENDKVFLNPSIWNNNNFIKDIVYLNPFIWDDTEFQNILYNNKSTLLNLKSWTWSGLSWLVNLINFNIKDTNNNTINIWSWTIDFTDFSIKINDNEKIEILNWKLDYKNSKINLLSGKHIKSGIEKNVSWTIDIDWFYLIQKDFTKESLITYLEDKLYLDRQLPTDIREKLIKFLSFDINWNPVNFDLTNTTYKNYYIKWLLQLMIIQPEYIMQSWYDKSSDIKNTSNEKFINNNSKLIVVKAWGWFDYLHWVIPKNEYDTYLEYRWTWALVWTWVLSLDDNYYINSSLSPFKDLYDAWYLKLINRVWTPDHSRWHDTASQKITSLNNTYAIEDEWIIGHFIKNEDYTKTIVMWWYAPLEFRWWNYLNVWSNAYFNISDVTNTAFRNYKREQIKDLLSTRNYPWDSSDVFKNSVVINNVALNSVTNWWRAWAWYNMEENFVFLESIFESNISSIARIWADWWYDTHWNQKEYLNGNLDKVAKRTAAYFNRVKDKQDVTIIIFSEFWRTNKINSSMWTDHWQWGWMFIISNNKNVLEKLNKKVYGNMSFKNAKENWLWVWVDYRAVYSSILQLLYWKDITNDLWAKFEIDKYDDITGPGIALFRKEYEQINTSRTKVKLKFDVVDTNFKPDQASYVKIQYGKNKDALTEEAQYNISRYMTLKEDFIDIYLNNIESKTTYFYKVTIYDNQYNTTLLEWSFVSPEIKNNTDILSLETDSRLWKYNNTNVWLKYNLVNRTSSWILLWDKLLSKDVIWENWITISTNSWTYINELNSTSTWTIWNWWFVVPQEINKDYFISSESIYDGKKLNTFYIDKIIKVWADKLWVWMKLNKNVTIKIPNLDSNKNYAVLSSEDWINWKKEDSSNIKKISTILELKTSHFTYFAIVETDNNWNIKTNVVIPPKEEEVENTTKNYNSNNWWPILKKDSCEFWDYSPSYYDNTCWTDPDEKIATMSVKTSESYRLEQALEEVRKNEEFKANIFENTFKNVENSDDKKDVMILIREKLSYINLWDYQLINIKWSKLNDKIKKIWQFIIDQKFSSEYTKKLINNLNDLSIYLSINELDSIDPDTKTAVLKKINEVIKDFSLNFRNAKRKISIKKTTPIIPTTPKPNIINTIKTPVTEAIKPVINETVIQNPISNELKNISTPVNQNITLKKLQYRVNIDKIYLKADPYWKKDVWILQKWDIVQQITQLHEKWFFKVKVINSSSLEEWIEGYIFLKYLTK